MVWTTGVMSPSTGTGSPVWGEGLGRRKLRVGDLDSIQSKYAAKKENTSGALFIKIKPSACKICLYRLLFLAIHL